MERGIGGAGEALFQRRIEFHLARRSCSMPTAGNGGFHLETLNPIDDGRGERRVERGEERERERGRGREMEKERGFLDSELGLRITFQRIGAGLANLGNTCYLNSVLQCLTYTEPFAAYLQSGKHKSSCHVPGFCAMCALQNHVMTALQSSGKILSPFHLVKNLRCISRNFRSSRQEDAHEYMVHLLESMHKCCLPSGVPSESPGAYEKSLVHKIFGGRLRSQVECMDCHYSSNKFDPFLDLSLEIDKADSVHKALLHFTAFEELDGGQRQYECQRCKHKVRAKKRLTVHKAPYVLTIHLKRFGTHIPGQKIVKRVKFEPTLDLKPFVSDQQEGDLKYTLYGVLVHAGWSTHSGHYYCYVRTSTGLWYSLNDNQVTQVGEKVVLEQKAYMLFYIRNRSLAPKRPLGSSSKENISSASGNGHVAFPGSKLVPQNGPTGEKLCTSERGTVIATPNIKFDRHDPTNVTFSVSSSTKEASLAQQRDQTLMIGVSSTHSNVNQIKRLQQSNGHIPADVVDPCLKGQPHLSENNNGHVPSGRLGSFQFKESGHLNVPRIEKGEVAGHVSAVQINLCNGLATSTMTGGLNIKDNGILSKEASKKQAASVSSGCTTLPKDSCPNVNHGKGVYLTTSESFPKVYDADQLSSLPMFENNHSEVAFSAANGFIFESNVVDEKPAKRPKCHHKRTVHIGARHLLIASWTLRKKKHLKCKKKHLCFAHSMNISIPGDEPSTSEMANMSNKHLVQSARKQMNGRRKQMKDSKRLSKKRSKKDRDAHLLSPAKKLNTGISNIKNVEDTAVLVSSGQTVTSSNLHVNRSVLGQEQRQTDCLNQSSILNMLMRGIPGAQVPKWDDSAMPSQNVDPIDKPNKGIGYVLDEWDEEYDRGRKKKVKRSSDQSIGGYTNPFQEIVLREERHKTKKKMKLDRMRLGTSPLRI